MSAGHLNKPRSMCQYSDLLFGPAVLRVWSWSSTSQDLTCELCHVPIQWLKHWDAAQRAGLQQASRCLRARSSDISTCHWESGRKFKPRTSPNLLSLDGLTQVTCLWCVSSLANWRSQAVWRWI